MTKTRTETVVGLLGIRHTVTGWTQDERGRYGDLTACGRMVFTAVRPSDDTVDCRECFPPQAVKVTRRKRS